MKKFWMALMVAIMGVTVVVSSAEAKRLGGGGSFGKSSPSYSRQAPAQGPGQSATAQRPAAPAAAPASPWRGILGGALLGLGLGALLSHFGLGGEFASMIGTALMIGLLAFGAIFLFRMLSKKTANQTPRPAFAGPMEKSGIPEVGSNLGSAPQPVNWQSGAAPAIPADFDTAGFLRHAKTNFLRMQAAWDKGDAQDIREFTTPEMFAELKMQLTERGASANHTDVVTLEAELMGIETVGDEHLASVRFNGMVKEDEHAPVEAFNEIWVLSKPMNGDGGWLLAGIQQV
jgi:predicted lipid-binding transport protein (Tim44 family)